MHWRYCSLALSHNILTFIQYWWKHLVWLLFPGEWWRWRCHVRTHRRELHSGAEGLVWWCGGRNHVQVRLRRQGDLDMTWGCGEAKWPWHDMRLLGRQGDLDMTWGCWGGKVILTWHEDVGEARWPWHDMRLLGRQGDLDMTWGCGGGKVTLTSLEVEGRQGVLVWLANFPCTTLTINVFSMSLTWLNTLRPRQNGRHFADDIFKCIFLIENVWIPIKSSLKFVPRGPIHNIPALV